MAKTKKKQIHKHVPKHPQAVIKTEGKEVLVDVGMEKMLRFLWKQNGIETMYSCQGSEASPFAERGYIMFRKTRASQHLMQLLLTHGDELRLHFETGVNFHHIPYFTLRFLAKDRKKLYKLLKNLYAK